MHRAGIAKTCKRLPSAVYKVDACKTPDTVGALLRREGAILLPPDDLTRGGPVTRVPDPRDKRIADVKRENLRWQRSAERAEAWSS